MCKYRTIRPRPQGLRSSSSSCVSGHSAVVYLSAAGAAAGGAKEDHVRCKMCAQSVAQTATSNGGNNNAPALILRRRTSACRGILRCEGADQSSVLECLSTECGRTECVAPPRHHHRPHHRPRRRNTLPLPRHTPTHRVVRLWLCKV